MTARPAEALVSRATTAWWAPPYRPDPDGEPTAVLYGPGGDLIRALDVTVYELGDDDEVEVEDVVSQSELTVDPDDEPALRATIPADVPIWWQSTHGPGGAVRVSEVDPPDGQGPIAVLLDAPVPGILRPGDTLHGLVLTAELTADDLAETGRMVRTTAGGEDGISWHRIEWEALGSDGQVYTYRHQLRVVSTLHGPPMTPAEASRYVTSAYTDAAYRDGGYWRALAERANARVYQRAAVHSWYLGLSGDWGLWRDAGHAALRVELAHEGLSPPGTQLDQYLQSQEAALDRAIATARAASLEITVTGQQTTRQPRRWTMGLVRS